MFGKSKARFEAKIERERNRWRHPLTPEGAHLSNAEAVIFVGVFAIILVLAGLLPSMPLLHLLVFGGGVLALSGPGRATMMPAVYGLMAAKFGWSPYHAALEMERAARQTEKDQARQSPTAVALAANPSPDAAVPSMAPASPAAPAGSKPVVLSSLAREVLETYLQHPRLDRLNRSEQVMEFLFKEGVPFVAPARDEEAPEDFPKDIDKAIRDFAKAQGIELKPVIAGVAHAQ